MHHFLLIGLCMVAGILFRRFGRLPADSHKSLNAWIIYLALPAVSFKYLPHIVWSRDLLIPAISPVLVWAGAWCWISVYARFTKPDKPTRASLLLVSGLSNTSFVGFPLVAAYFGESMISTAIICDQVTFLLLSTVGVAVSVKASNNQSLNLVWLLKKVLTFPPFLGCLFALTVPRFTDISAFSPLIDRLAGTVGPLALFSIGLQLRFEGWHKEIPNLVAALAYKLWVAPTLALLLVWVLGGHGLVSKVTVFEAAMATLVSSGVVADQYNNNPKLASLVIGTGIVLSFITTFFWWLLLS